MKTSTEFPGVYRVRARKDTFGFWWWGLERLHLGAFCYSWPPVESWLKEPTKEEVAKAIAEDRAERLQEEQHEAFEPYFVSP